MKRIPFEIPRGVQLAAGYIAAVSPMTGQTVYVARHPDSWCGPGMPYEGLGAFVGTPDLAKAHAFGLRPDAIHAALALVARRQRDGERVAFIVEAFGSRDGYVVAWAEVSASGEIVRDEEGP